MVNVNKNNSINYIELPMVKNAETKKFYHQAFEWELTDWGPDYISFSGANIDGGFRWASTYWPHAAPYRGGSIQEPIVKGSSICQLDEHRPIGPTPSGSGIFI